MKSSVFIRLSHVSAARVMLVLLWTTPLLADSTTTSIRTVAHLAEGVYAIRHPDAPDGFPQGNTTVIIGERDVMVVDACYLPSSAREDLAQIRQWTNKPVKYLVNTHWHYDHTMGNGVYAEEFPSITIVAHTETRRQMAGYNPGWFERFPSRADNFKKAIESGKDINGRALSEEDKKEYAKAADGVALVHKEYQHLVDRVPNLSFDHTLSIDLGGREVEIRHLGRGNTAGDVVVYLPKERILATGDLLDHPVPYLGGGYPFDQVKTLRAMASMDVETYVPGHGDVLRGQDGKAYLNLVIEFISVVSEQVSREVHRVGSGPRKLEEVREAVHKAIDMDAWRRKFAGDHKSDGDFFDSFSVQGIVTAAYAQVWGR